MAAAGWKALRWEIPPQNGHDLFFSRDIYEKYSLAPTLSELLFLSRRGAKDKVGTPNSEPGKQASRRPPTGKPVQPEPSPAETPWQEPRIPYPYFSCLSEKEQRRYLFLLSEYFNADPQLLHSSEQRNYSQYLQMKEFVSAEVADFLKFAQNAARNCPKDYDVISEEALLYAKDFLSARISSVKKYPEWYTLHEVTSIMGGKFSRELELKLEKNLLVLGKVNIIKRYFPKLPASIRLPPDKRREELDIGAPEQRASGLHHDVSTDPNAEKLVAKYCPQVVLTGESFYALLNNHGPDYKEPWELPVSVKVISLAGLKPVKVVFIDPPLPKKEMTVREKNQLFHEVLANFHMTKQSSILAHAAILDRPREEPLEARLQSGQGRPVPESIPAAPDFSPAVPERETFGSQTEPLSSSKAPAALAKPAGSSTVFSESLKLEMELEWAVSSSEGKSGAEPQRETFSYRKGDFQGLGCKDKSSGKDSEPVETDPNGKTVALVQEENPDPVCFSHQHSGVGKGTGAARDEKSAPSHCSDTEEPLLIIEDTQRKPGSMAEPCGITSECGPVGVAPASPLSRQAPSGRQAGPPENVPTRGHQRFAKRFDPVGQILKMQTELLSFSSPSGQGQCQGARDHGWNPAHIQGDLHAKPLASSSAGESRQDTMTPTGTSSGFSWTTRCQDSQKGALWDAAEDASDYDPPPNGNLVYKLFSLEDLLLLIRCPVQKVELRPPQKKAKFRRHFPVFVLPKLEYQSFYGAEALTEGEVCQLWMESLLHSTTSFMVGHIDALTSKLFLLEQLTVEGLRRRFGSFKPSNSLNILQNVLKKAASLQEGHYLLAHAAGDSSVMIYRSSGEEAPWATYNLHEAHSDLPAVPVLLSVPWVPLDPNTALPHHFAQGRVPCTFPPRPAEPGKSRKASGAHTASATPSPREPVSMETNHSCAPANLARKRRGAGPDQVRRQSYPHASQGPNRTPWKRPRVSHDGPA